MRKILTAFLCTLVMNGIGQAVNEKITVMVSQPPMLRVEAGSNVVLEQGTAVIGQTAYITGGTPDYSYKWKDKHNNEYDDLLVTVELSGQYQLNVTDMQNCTAVDSLQVIDYTSINQAGHTQQVPGIIFDHQHRQLLITFDTPVGKTHLRLIAPNGTVVYEDIIGFQQGEGYPLNLQSIPPGVYVLSVGKERFYTGRKIVIY